MEICIIIWEKWFFKLMAIVGCQVHIICFSAMQHSDNRGIQYWQIVILNTSIWRLLARDVRDWQRDLTKYKLLAFEHICKCLVLQFESVYISIAIPYWELNSFGIGGEIIITSMAKTLSKLATTNCIFLIDM